MSPVSKQQLTVRQIADLIRRPHEEMGTVVDRIRGWADVGLLAVAGDKHPGTGKKRLYEPGAIIDAVVLTALTDAGLAAVRVGHFAGPDKKTVLAFGRMGACDVLDPGERPSPAFLEIVGPSQPAALVLVRVVDDEEKPLNQLARARKSPWSIVLNLTEYFLPLRDRGVTAVWDKGGFAKIELVTKKD